MDSDVSDSEPTVSGGIPHADDLRTLALICYVLDVLSYFFGGVPALVAVIIAHVKQGDARGTWVASHFRWLIRTFWLTLLWIVLLVAGALVLSGTALLTAPADMTLMGPMLLAMAGALVVAVWNLYRVIKGLIRILEHRAVE